MTVPVSDAHAAKYEALALKLGKAALRALVPVPLVEVRAALDAGDKHLNTIPLRKWDAAAGRLVHAGRGRSHNADANFDHRHDMQRNHPVFPLGMPLSKRVCLLKHVARQAAEAL